MDCFFEARSISSDTMRQAYAVMLLGIPDLTLPEFRKLAARTRTGVLTGLFDRRGYVHALFRSRIIVAGTGGRRLSIGDLILSDAISARLGNEMVDALMFHAASVGCDQLTVEMAPLPQIDRLLSDNMLENLGISGVRAVCERRA